MRIKEMLDDIWHGLIDLSIMLCVAVLVSAFIIGAVYFIPDAVDLIHNVLSWAANR